MLSDSMNPLYDWQRQLLAECPTLIDVLQHVSAPTEDHYPLLEPVESVPSAFSSGSSLASFSDDEPEGVDKLISDYWAKSTDDIPDFIPPHKRVQFPVKSQSAPCSPAFGHSGSPNSQFNHRRSVSTSDDGQCNWFELDTDTDVPMPYVVQQKIFEIDYARAAVAARINAHYAMQWKVAASMMLPDHIQHQEPPLSPPKSIPAAQPATEPDEDSINKRFAAAVRRQINSDSVKQAPRSSSGPTDVREMFYNNVLHACSMPDSSSAPRRARRTL